MKGTVKFYQEQKGYGFIFSSEINEDIYFNIKEWKNESIPNGNDEVEFQLDENKKGKFALNINLLKSALEKKEEQSAKKDDRIICFNCNKKIVPRIMYLNAAPYSSHCPYCGEAIKKFQHNVIFIIFAVTIIIFIVMFVFIASTILKIF